jgi:PAS domain S-box-containing protein
MATRKTPAMDLFASLTGGDIRPAFIVDARGTILAANPALALMTETTIEDLPGKKIHKFITPDDRRQLRAALTASRKHAKPIVLPTWPAMQPNRFNVTFLKGKTAKTDVYLVAPAQPVDFHDRIMQFSIDHAPFGIFNIDATGQIRWVNNRAAQALGYSRAELVQRTIFDVDIHLTPEMWNDHRSKLRAIGHRIIESEHKRKDGTIFPVEVSVSTIFIDGEEWTFSTALDITERRLTETALKESEEKLAKAFQVVPAPIVISDIDTGAFYDVSQQWLTLTGYSPEELKGETSRSIGLWEDWEERRAIVERLRTEGSFHEVPTRIKRKDGSIRQVLWSGEVISVSGKKAMLSLLYDITDRLRADEALREKTDELDRYFSNALDLFCIVDNNGCFKRLNKQWENALGYTLAELEGSRFLDYVHPDDLAATLDATAKIGTPDVLQEFVNRYRAKDGSYRWLEWHASPTGSHVHAAARDITDRRKMLDELRAVTAGARCLIWHARVVRQAGVYTWDIHVLNEDAAAMMLPVEIPEGMTFSEGWSLTRPREDEDRLARDYICALDRNKSRYSHEFRCQIKDGTMRWLYEDVRVKQDSANEWDLIGVCTDITERKHAEEALQQLNEKLEERVRNRTAELEQANKELESFSYSVSHDLRAPLRAIDGYARILTEEYNDRLEDEGRRFCSIIRTETQRMGQLIDDLLSFSRLSRWSMQYVPLDTTGIVESVLHDLLPGERRNRVEIHSGPFPDAAGDPNLIRQVWVNLLSNAVKFSSKREHPRIDISGTLSDNEVLFSVKDNGAGFDMQYADKLFGVFQRLHSVSEFDGTGVGLAIVERIVHRHGGRVWADGKPGEGATFHFSLPNKGI